MFRLRCGSKVLLSAAGFLPLCVFLLAGCATTTSLTRNESVELSQAHEPAQVEIAPVHRIQVSSADADLVIARAIAEHEMRRP
jgi:hypothetical protein